MDWSLIIFIVVVAFFAYRGFKKGLVKSLSRVLSLLAGYIAAILYAPQVSDIIEAQFQLQGIAAFITASLALFFGAGLVVSLLFWVFEKLRPANENVSTVSSLGGTSIGLVVGVIVATVIVWTYSFMRDMSSMENTDAQAQTKKSTIENLANRAASKVVKSVMSIGSASPEVKNLSAALAESPAKMAQHAQRLASNNDLSSLLNDPHNQAVLNTGNVKAVQQLYAFKKLAKNPDMLTLAKSAGMLGESGDNTQAMEAALASQFTDIWGRTKRVKSDRRVQEILSDPEFQQKINSGNPIDLLTNPRLMELTDIIFSESAAPQGAGNNATGDITSENNMQGIPKKETSIYSWTDKNGRIHYSDSEPGK